ncbi:Transcriptional regulator, AraC family [Labilithrix luteola]|uniref:Transcriptional regulator, AraC family n=1 Tax=Labilithrix luteola TaxID=1391654 RepID=A0A0K1PN63_9BACT|nr:AraC family transcriptional regulator [Labilithrix luteola]AKU94968.1 Transcriptional regulator, AraC family [Labilithrix luteola]
MPTALIPLGRYPRVRTSSVEEATQVFGARYSSVNVEPTKGTAFEWRANGLSVGAIDIGAHAYGAGHTATSEVGDVFSISFARGAAGANATIEKERVRLERDTTTITSPGVRASFCFQTGFESLLLAIRQPEMAAALGALLGTKARGPLRFTPAVSLTSGVGASLHRLVRFIVDEADRADADYDPLASPLVAAHLADAVIYKMLLELPHNYSAQLTEAGNAEPLHVRRAAEYLAANAARGVRMAELTELTGVNLRTLQLAFQKYRGCSPMAFLRERRLQMAREKLLQSPLASVTDIALDCGFAHLGRFSAHYRACFGESPSDTRRRRSR